MKRRIKYHARIALKTMAASALSCFPSRRLESPPAVTLFISSLNTRYPLELTLKSMLRHTRYPNYRLWIGENASTDGSLEYLESLCGALPLRLMRSAEPRLHSHWLDEMFQTVETPYWLAVDSDMLFLGSDWLNDILSLLESDPELDLVAAERRDPIPRFTEPVSGEVIHLGEAPSTWLLAVRTSLRERLQSSFAFTVYAQDEETGMKRCYDTGGQLLADMREHGLRYRYMPASFTWKYYHFGSLSWVHTAKGSGEHQQFKRYQLRDIQRRASKTALGARRSALGGEGPALPSTEHRAPSTGAKRP
jgi:hypothetical protein